MAQTLVKNYLHIVFSTKGRAPLIVSSIEKELHYYLVGLCKELECYPIKIGGYDNHLHIVINLAKKIALATFMENIKGHSSKWIKTKDKSLENYSSQLGRILAGAENNEIEFAVNASGAFPKSDNIAFSGGIAWAVATLIAPELNDNAVVAVTYDEVLEFSEKLFKNPALYSDYYLVKTIPENSVDTQKLGKDVKQVNKVFDQRALLAGTGLLLKIMRQFNGVVERKKFYLVKNGSVGWISAYVNQNVSK